jgi:hypothetical protein
MTNQGSREISEQFDSLNRLRRLYYERFDGAGAARRKQPAPGRSPMAASKDDLDRP